ncbi:hypothetical protein ACIQGZ_09615 [Streptomyces sp. NPDC092296]|uniref:hypothetical protein n=1 Tax=Streptomyces sp. NPDC092296 TaxID=3366012 RepID=UPI00381EC6F3
MDAAAGAAEEPHADARQRGSGPAHAHSGPVHWVATAAAIGAVIAAAVVVAPAQGAPLARRPAGGPETSPAPAAPVAVAPDPAKAALPLDCGSFPVKVAHSFARDLDGDGRPETVAAAHCDGTNGTPSDGVYVLSAGPDGQSAPTVAATLVRPAENFSVLSLEPGDDGTVTADVSGYSTGDVPRCCPDVSLILSWARNGDHWVRAQIAAP